MHGSTDAVPDSDATLALEQDALGKRARLDAAVRAPADRIEIAVGRAHAATVGDRRLAHGYAVLPGTVVVGVVRDPDLALCLDQRSIEEITRLGVGDAERALPTTVGVISLASIGFHALEERQDVLVAPAPIAHLGPCVEILRLPPHEGVTVDRARAAEQAAARGSQSAAIGTGLGLGGVEPVGGRVIDQLGVADRNAAPAVAGRSGLKQ